MKFNPAFVLNSSHTQYLAFSREEVDVSGNLLVVFIKCCPIGVKEYYINMFQVTCQDSYACKMDYMTTGKREIGLDTLDAELKFLNQKYHGEKKRKVLRRRLDVINTFCQFFSYKLRPSSKERRCFETSTG